MTQNELAKKIGYKSGSSINKIELGIADVPQSKIKNFAVALNTEPSYLVNWYKNEDNIYDYQTELIKYNFFNDARNHESMVMMFDSSSKDLEFALSKSGLKVYSYMNSPEF